MLRFKKLLRFPLVLWWLPLLAIAMFFYPILFGGKLFFNLDFSRAEDMPIHFWFSSVIKHGNWHVNPLYFGGIPSYLSQLDLLHPISFLFYRFLSPLSAYHWLIVLGFIGQWYFFYLLSRKLKISPMAAVFASFVWIFNQWNIQMGSMVSMSIFFASVPLLFFLIIKISEGQHRYWYSALTTLVLAPNWVFSLTQTTLYLASTLVILAAFMDHRLYKFDLAKYKNTILCIVIILLSVAIVLPFVKADYAVYSLSFRSGGLSYQKSVNDYYNGFDLIHFVSPLIILPFINTEYIHFYLGILPLLLVFLVWKAKPDNFYIKFFQWMAIISLLLAVKYSPLFYVLTKIPVFNFFRGAGKFLFLTDFALALLAGFGLDMLREHEGRAIFSGIGRFYMKFLIVAASLLVAINLLYAFAFDYLIKLGFKAFLRFGYSHTLQRDPSSYIGKVKELLNSWFYQFSFSNIEIWLMLAALFSTGVIVALFLKNKVSFRSFSILAIAVVYFSSFFIWQKYYHFVSASVLRPTPAIEFLMSHKDDRYRTITFNLGIETYKKMGLDYKNPEELYKFEVATLTSDAFMYYNIETLNGHEAFITKRQEFISEFNSQFATQTMTPDEKKKLFESKINLLSMMGVKYILSSVPLDEPFIKRFESTITDTQIPLYVYENPEVLPRIYFSKFQVFSQENLPDGEVKERVLAVKDFKDKTLIECNDCKESLLVSGVINNLTYKPDLITLDTQNNRDSWMVLSNAFFPGWHAFVDGHEVKLYRANYLFQAIRIPAGNHKVEFNYKIL